MWILIIALCLSQILTWFLGWRFLRQSERSFRAEIGAVWQELLEWTQKHAKFHKDLGQVVDKVVVDEKKMKADLQRTAKVLEQLRIIGRRRR
jgi:cytochrome c556